jgi:hypothetical protein
MLGILSHQRVVSACKFGGSLVYGYGGELTRMLLGLRLIVGSICRLDALVSLTTAEHPSYPEI